MQKRLILCRYLFFFILFCFLLLLLFLLFVFYLFRDAKILLFFGTFVLFRFRFLLWSDAKIQFFFDTLVFFFSHLPLHFHHSVNKLLLCGEIQLLLKSQNGFVRFSQSCVYMSIVLAETSLIATAVWTQLDMCDKKDVLFPAVLP